MPDAILTIQGRAEAVHLTGNGPWQIGRDDRSEIHFPDDPGCSRTQARIRRDGGGGFILENLSTRSATRFDANPLTSPVALYDGATITFSKQRLTFVSTNVGRREPAPGPAGVRSAETVILSVIEVATLDTQAPAVDRLALDHSFSVGRLALPNQVVLDHPAVSRQHAIFDISDGGVTVRDAGSTNGTFVNGTRLARPHRLVSGDRVDIGPFQFTFDGSALSSSSRSGNVDLLVRGVGREVAGAAGWEGKVRILDRATFHIRPRELICIIGASGSGKSTLLNILSGRIAPSDGMVLLNGVDLHANFEALKQDIAFIPQQDVLHEQLTLRQALEYAARLRLPPDMSAAQRHAAVATAAENVDLLDHLDDRIVSLSGGQKKRAGLASEIMQRPSLLFLDEVTSGLDESTDREIMHLLRRLADQGMTIIVVTHTLANIEQFCHRVICMGTGGHTTFVGRPEEALRFFNLARIGLVFDRIAETGAVQWRQRFEASPLYDRSARSADRPSQEIVRRPEPIALRARRMMRQFVILVGRNTRLLHADRRNLIMAAVQSTLIGGLLGYAFGSFGTGLQRSNCQNALLFLIGLTSLWLGCNGASKDIVGELVIYRRERDVNLSTTAFVAAKYVVTSVFTILQLVVVFLFTALLAEDMPGGLIGPLPILVLGSLAGTAMGLVISASANTRDQATTIVPLALVPQIILAGILVPNLPAIADAFAKVGVSAYWLTEMLKAQFIATDGPVEVLDAATGHIVALTSQPACLGALMVSAHTVVLLTAAWLITLLRNGRRQIV